MNPIDIKRALLVFEAKRWVGTKEIGGDNRGQIVELFQKSINPNPSGESWCADFVWYCIEQTDRLYAACIAPDSHDSTLMRSERVLNLFTGSSVDHRAHDGEVSPGDIVCWEFFNDEGRATGLGHCGVVVAKDGFNITTVEGNTSDGHGINREGNGVYLRQRVIANAEGKFRILGFLKPWV